MLYNFSVRSQNFVLFDRNTCAAVIYLKTIGLFFFTLSRTITAVMRPVFGNRFRVPTFKWQKQSIFQTRFVHKCTCAIHRRQLNVVVRAHVSLSLSFIEANSRGLNELTFSSFVFILLSFSDLDVSKNVSIEQNRSDSTTNVVTSRKKKKILTSQHLLVAEWKRTAVYVIIIIVIIANKRLRRPAPNKRARTRQGEHKKTLMEK